VWVRDIYSCFKDTGVADALGIDGSWCNKELLFNILIRKFLEKI